MRRVIVVFATLVLVGASVAFACTGFLMDEKVVRLKSGRTVRLCYYDHLGDPHIITVPDYSFCRVTVNIPHPGEDRDGDGKDDGEEQ